MAATKTRSAPSANGSTASNAVDKVKETGVTAARRAKGPMLAAGATVAGLAGGLALGSRFASKRRKNRLTRTAEALGRVARELSAATSKVSETTEEVRQVREQLDRANRQSPIEVLLDGLTHRRGAHKPES